jgi:hypothetical protein
MPEIRNSNHYTLRLAARTKAALTDIAKETKWNNNLTANFLIVVGRECLRYCKDTPKLRSFARQMQREVVLKTPTIHE